MKAREKAVLIFAGGAAAVILGAASVMLMSSGPAVAKPEFSASTGRPCGVCHQNPGGGGKLKPFGERFKANGYKLKK
jgi:hypothetical protein